MNNQVLTIFNRLCGFFGILGHTVLSVFSENILLHAYILYLKIQTKIFDFVKISSAIQ